MNAKQKAVQNGHISGIRWEINFKKFSFFSTLLNHVVCWCLFGHVMFCMRILFLIPHDGMWKKAPSTSTTIEWNCRWIEGNRLCQFFFLKKINNFMKTKQRPERDSSKEVEKKTSNRESCEAAPSPNPLFLISFHCTCAFLFHWLRHIFVGNPVLNAIIAAVIQYLMRLLRTCWSKLRSAETWTLSIESIEWLHQHRLVSKRKMSRDWFKIQ